MNYKKQEFKDGEIEIFSFPNKREITLITHKFQNKYHSEIGWNFNTTRKTAFYDILNTHYTTYFDAKLKPIKELYNSLKKQKNKSKEIKLLISALMIINHEIKNQQFKQLKLF